MINPNGAGETSHSGTWYAWLDGYGTTHTDTLSQTVTIPAGCTHDHIQLLAAHRHRRNHHDDSSSTS